MKKQMILWTCLLAWTGLAHARVIDYPGSLTLMQMNDGSMNSVHFHYTVKPYYSVGYNFDAWREEEWIMNAGQLAWLLHRWNLPEAQANLYARGALGVATSDFGSFEDETQLAGSAGIAFDIEDRRFYFSYQNRYVDAGSIYDGFDQKARVGIAPYIAEYGGLHTWIMLQVEHWPGETDEWVWTPMLRFFKGDILVEIGYSDSEKVLFNTMIRF